MQIEDILRMWLINNGGGVFSLSLSLSLSPRSVVEWPWTHVGEGNSWIKTAC